MYESVSTPFGKREAFATSLPEEEDPDSEEEQDIFCCSGPPSSDISASESDQVSSQSVDFSGSVP